MTIALISDVHGNLPALEAVFEDIDKHNDVTKVISLGDISGYYPMINECIQLLKENNVTNIQGNHDYYLTTNTSCKRSLTVDGLIDYQRKIITPDNLQWLKLSVEKIEDNEVSIVHGGWKNNTEEYMYKLREEYFASLPFKWFFSGHTHVQLEHRFSTGQTYCNPGSVGQPRDGNPKSGYVLFDGESIVHKRVSYNIDKVANHMKLLGFESKLYSNLYLGTRIGGKVDKILIE